MIAGTTRKDLEALLDKARNAPRMTDDEWRAQRESFVRGQIAMGSDREEAKMREDYRAEQEFLNQG